MFFACSSWPVTEGPRMHVCHRHTCHLSSDQPSCSPASLQDGGAIAMGKRRRRTGKIGLFLHWITSLDTDHVLISVVHKVKLALNVFRIQHSFTGQTFHTLWCINLMRSRYWRMFTFSLSKAALHKEKPNILREEVCPCWEFDPRSWNTDTKYLELQMFPLHENKTLWVTRSMN